jgi:hypothetical protein
MNRICYWLLLIDVKSVNKAQSGGSVHLTHLNSMRKGLGGKFLLKNLLDT